MRLATMAAIGLLTAGPAAAQIEWFMPQDTDTTSDAYCRAAGVCPPPARPRPPEPSLFERMESEFRAMEAQRRIMQPPAMPPPQPNPLTCR